MSIATMTSEGQVTVPVAVRERLGLRAGDRLEFEVLEDGTVRMRKLPVDILDLVGIVGSDRHVSIEEMNEAIARGWSGK